MQTGEQDQASIIQQSTTQYFDASFKIFTTGLTDMDVYSCEPGYERKEPIDSEDLAICRICVYPCLN